MEKGNSTAKKVFTAIGNIIIWLFVIFAAAVTVFTFAAQSSADGVPAIGGNAILTVNTDSMSPTFNAGDIIIGKKLLPEEISSLAAGDVITYNAGDLDGDGMRDFNTHRIVEVIKDENGNVSFVTKGDNFPYNDDGQVDSQNVICKYNGTRIKGLGKVLSFLQTSKGFLLVIVLPLVLFFIFELINFIRKFAEVKGKGKNEITAEDEERIRKQAIEEFLRSQGEEKSEEPEKAETAETTADTAEEK